MWWSKDKFKYVKFSRGTAKKNPDMIINEYKRIIEDLNSRSKGLWEYNTKVTIEIPVHRNPLYAYPYEFENSSISLSAMEIIKAHKRIISRDKEQLAILERLKKVEDELEMFKRKYRKWLQ